MTDASGVRLAFCPWFGTNRDCMGGGADVIRLETLPDTLLAMEGSRVGAA